MKKLILLLAALAASTAAYAGNPQLGFNELVANQAQPHLTINAADRSITNAIAGQITLNVVTDANISLTSSQWEYAAIVLTDTGVILTTARDLIYPNVDMQTGGASRMAFIFKNSTAKTITVKRSGQSGVAVTAGSMALLHHNGTDIEEISGGGGGGGTVDLTSDVTGILPGANGGTSSGFTAFSGPASTLKTFTLPNASATVLTTNAAVTIAQGGTGITSASDDQTLVSNGSAWFAKTLPDCLDTGGNHINYTQSTNAFSCGTSSSGGGGGGSVAGSDTQIQFNDGGSFGADADFTWTKSTNTLAFGSTAVPGIISAPVVGPGTDGIALTIQSGNGGPTTFGSGGNLYFYGGSAPAAGSGGNIIIQAGQGVGADNGSIRLRGPAGGTYPIGVDKSGVLVVNNGNAGTSRQVLMSGGASGPADFSTLIAADIPSHTVRTVTAAGTVTVTTTDYHVCINKTAGAATLVSLQASPTTGFELTIDDCKGDAGTNNITTTPAAGTIDGAATLVINTNYGSASMYYNGVMWKVTAVR